MTMKYLITIILLLAVNSIAFGQGKSVDYKVEGNTYEGYFTGGKSNAPLVLLIHDWDGLTDYEVKRAEMLADLGYAVFAADLFGKGIRPVEFNERRKLTSELYNNREKMRSLLYGSLEAAKSVGGNTGNAVVIGYCFGGAAVLEFARSGADLKGFVTFHGGLSTPEGENYSKTKGKVLVFHGTADSSVTMDQFAALAKELEQFHVSHEMTTYSGAPHAFTVFGSDRYRADADKKSWNRFKEFLSETLE